MLLAGIRGNNVSFGDLFFPFFRPEKNGREYHIMYHTLTDENGHLQCDFSLFLYYEESRFHRKTASLLAGIMYHEVIK